MTLTTSGLSSSSMYIDTTSSNLTWTTTNNLGSVYVEKQGIWQKIKQFFGAKSTKYSIEEFFGLIKGGVSSTNKENARIYAKLLIKKIKEAHRLGQNKVIDSLNKQLGGLRKEIQVIGLLGLTKYVYESDVADLEDNGIQDRVIYRSSLANYMGEIPNNKSKSIIKAKESGLFDEIIILYTRTKTRAMELDKKKTTKSSYRRKVDPICFGKIDSTDKLFIIADWIDEECDLNVKKLEGLVKIKEVV